METGRPLRPNLVECMQARRAEATSRAQPARAKGGRLLRAEHPSRYREKRVCGAASAAMGAGNGACDESIDRVAEVVPSRVPLRTLS